MINQQRKEIETFLTTKKNEFKEWLTSICEKNRVHYDDIEIFDGNLLYVFSIENGFLKLEKLPNGYISDRMGLFFKL